MALITAYPTDFDAWKKRGTDRLVTAIANEFADPVVLSIQTDVRVILPAVFYGSARRPLQEVLSELYSVPLSDTARQEIVTKFVVGRENLRREETKEVLAFFQPTFSRPNCQNGNDTTYLLNYTRTVLVRLTDAETFQDFCINKPDAIGQTIGICQNCSNTIKQHVEDATRRIWEKLPELFVLPAWEVLIEADDLQEQD